MELDEKDKKILNELQKDSRQSVRSIGKKIGVPPTTVHSRIKKLEDSGVIRKYTTLLEHNKADLPTTAFVLVNESPRRDPSDKWSLESLAKKIEKLHGVCEVHGLAGRYDLLVKMVGKDEGELGWRVAKKIKDMVGVEKSETIFSYYTEKEEPLIELK